MKLGPFSNYFSSNKKEITLSKISSKWNKFSILYKVALHSQIVFIYVLWGIWLEYEIYKWESSFVKFSYVQPKF